MIGHYETQTEMPEDFWRFLQRKTMSDAAAFCALAWKQRHCHNWDTVNGLASNLIRYALEAGLEWHEDDLSTYHFLTPKEDHYARAIGKHGCGDGRLQSSPSFVKAFEKWAKREPFLFAWDTKAKQRLYVGITFWWQGHTVELTSFGMGCINAVKYRADCYRGENYGKPRVGKVFHAYDIGNGPFKLVARKGKQWVMEPTTEDVSSRDGPAIIERRFKITHADLDNALKASRAGLKLWQTKIRDAGSMERAQKLVSKHRAEIEALLTPYDLEQLRHTEYKKEEEAGQ